MRWTPEELKKRVADLPDDVKDTIIYGVAWDMFGDITDDGEHEYIDSDRTPDSPDLTEAVGWLREELTKDRPELTVKEVLRGGELELEVGQTMEEILESAGACLDRACSSEICGEVVFVGSDGKHYVGCVEFVIDEANPEYLKDVLTEDEEED